MRTQKQSMSCGDCLHEWDDDLLLDVSVDLFCHALKDVKCPKCGSHNVNLKN